MFAVLLQGQCTLNVADLPSEAAGKTKDQRRVPSSSPFSLPACGKRGDRAGHAPLAHALPSHLCDFHFGCAPLSPQ